MYDVYSLCINLYIIITNTPFINAFLLNWILQGQFNMQIQPFACIVAGLLLLSCTLQTSVAEADHGKMKSMAEVLQILQNLDKYYTQAARPR